MKASLSMESTYRIPENLRASFIGLIGGEWLKMWRKWGTWLWIAFILVAIVGGISLMAFSGADKAEIYKEDPLAFFFKILTIGLDFTRIFGGIAVIFIAASCLGMEFQMGTMRVLLSRGVGRIQLVLAKLVTVFFFGVITLIVGLLATLGVFLAFLIVKNLGMDLFGKFTADFWRSIAIVGGVHLLNILLTELLALFLVMLTRSYAVGMTLAVLWFPLDNIGSNILGLFYEITNMDIFKNLPTYLLGPNLNLAFIQHIPAEFQRTMEPLSSFPMVPPSGTNNWIILGVYALFFLVTTLVLFVRRDVRE